MAKRTVDVPEAGEVDNFTIPVIGCHGPALVHRFVSRNGTSIRGRQYLPHIEFYREVLGHVDSQAAT